MNKIKIFLIMMILSFVLFGQAVPRFSNNDSWTSQSGTVFKYDKLEHFTGSFILETAIHYKFKTQYSKEIALGLGVAWELKDAFLPYEKYGWIGGEGFSFYDLGADALGVVSSYCFRRFVFNPLFNRKRK